MVHLHSCGLDLLKKGEVVAAVVRAKEAGKTRFIGYSGDGEAARYAIELGVFDSLQTSVNIADQQSIDLLLPYCLEHGIGVVAKRPVANVAWKNGDREPDNGYAKPYWERLQRLRYKFLQGSPEETAATALRFTLSQPGVCVAIVGTKNPSRWAANAAAAAKGPLTPQEVKEIRDRWLEIRNPEWVGLG